MLSRLLVVAPAVPPKLNVLVVDIPAVMFDVPVNVNADAFAIDNTVVPAVVWTKTILPVVPNARTLVAPVVELKIPVVKVWLFKSRVPSKNEVVAVVPVVNASANVDVIPIPFTVREDIVFPVDVNVPVPTIENDVDV